ncbi:MAG: PilZ domain-containing protein [Nitrospiraceae bacterium]
MEPTVEQRKHRRHSVNFQGIFSSDTVQGEEGVVQDLSLGGCRVGSPILMPADTSIQLQIRPRQAAPIYVPSAIVRWVRGSTFGVQFQVLAEHESKALTRLLWSLPPSRQDESSNPRSKG